MATWKAENSMLTQVGVEILNKIKAGVGSITVTRVVAGSGRVPASQLFQQTALSGTIKPMVITQKDVRDSGCEISIYITNADYTESFDLNQIGVYVTHPDYLGEQLYHISQCESVGFDVIPALGETPVTFGYSLFLEHGNSESINLTVDTQGMVRIYEFSAFKGDITFGNLIEVDSEGNLKDTGKKISDISNRNYLHNWYFANPVNRRDGYVVPPNTPYYSEPTLTTQVGTVSAYTKCNILPNQTYCTIAIGTTMYYVSKNASVKGYANPWEYTLDRWLNGGDGILLVEPTGVKVTGAIDQFLSINPEAGVYTCSALMSDGTLDTVMIEYDGVTEVHQVGLHLHFTIDPVSGLPERPRFRLYPIGTKTVVAIKLEKGSISTLKYDIPADPAMQVAMCVQYDLATDTYIGLDFLRATGGTVTGPVKLTGRYRNQLLLGEAKGGAEVYRDADGRLFVINYLDDNLSGRREFRIEGSQTGLATCVKFASNESGDWKSYVLYGEHNKHLLAEVIPATLE